MDDFFDDEFESDDSNADESGTDECPHCGEPVFDDAEQCPYCNNYIVWNQSNRFSPLAKIMVWAMILALLLPAIIAVFNLF